MARHDLIVIGGGVAGLVTAAGAAALGLRTVLVERERLGGDCLWVGCVPTKALMASARAAHDARHTARWGLPATPGYDALGAFGDVMARMRRVRARIAVHDDPDRFRRLGVEVKTGEARVVGPREVRVDGATVAGKRIVVATGAGPVRPSIPGLDEAPTKDYQTVLDLTALPRRICVLGGGPIGLEFSQIFARLGATVTVLEALPGLLPREEAEAGAVLADLLRAEGITIETGASVERIERQDGEWTVRVRVGDRDARVPTDLVFVATGRRPRGEDLGLEGVGVGVEQGAVQVDGTLRTALRSIWAAGDVTGGPQFTHVADYHAKLLLRNLLVPLRARVRYDRLPMVTYTDPEVARVGRTEAEARDRYGRVRVYRYDLGDLDRAIVDGRDEGFVKVVTRPNGRIVGATIVGHGAGEFLPVLVLAMQRRVPFPHLARLVWAYPTMAEGIKRAADLHYREALAGRRGRLLRAVVRWLA